MNKISLTPSKTISAGSIGVLIFFLIFGIGFAFLIGNVLQENEAPILMSTLFYLFIIIWNGTVLFMLIYHIKNFKNENGLSLFEVRTEKEYESGSYKDNPIQKLRDLEMLKKDGLVSEYEYQQKRTEIMKKSW